MKISFQRLENMLAAALTLKQKQHTEGEKVGGTQQQKTSKSLEWSLKREASAWIFDAYRQMDMKPNHIKQ